ncbi:MarR family transcriptional regulator [Actinomycetospora endophytica]|uniref:MarR family transcriptional regulator n=1 Tax=Actinomycetospora endophytica TaxID=2291215 RepID=A0ABS8PEH9_9PSEU|nr:MarR family transcriptional regulator [Actinomycetospora endophytica]MCD2196671.1 MarR family transcriptional regulator [Actinomycetospora endophytica]
MTEADHKQEREAEIVAATDELTDLLVDHLLPVVQRYRESVAARLDLGLPELHTLDLLRRLGSLSSGAIGERVGLTRSTTSKMLRRLEAAGHVVREPDVAHRQGWPVSLVPHEERDLDLAAFRRRIRSTVRSAVTTYGLYRRANLAVAAGLVIHVVHGLQLTVTAESERTWWQRAKVRRRRAREAAGLH